MLQGGGGGGGGGDEVLCCPMLQGLCCGLALVNMAPEAVVRCGRVGVGCPVLCCSAGRASDGGAPLLQGSRGEGPCEESVGVWRACGCVVGAVVGCCVRGEGVSVARRCVGARGPGVGLIESGM